MTKNKKPFKFKSHREKIEENEADTSTRGEKINYEDSLTVPDQSLSIREIIQRFTTGQTLPIGKRVYYDDETGDPYEVDPTLDPAFDLADATEIQNRLVDQAMKNKKQKKETSDVKKREDEKNDEQNDEQKDEPKNQEEVSGTT